jgi:ferredoxin-NADP reductase
MAIVKKYSAEIVSIQNFFKGVYTLEMISLGKPFKYDPGQFIHLSLDEYDPSGQWPESRCFSIQSAPGNQTIKITYAVKGIFTSRMENVLRIGSKITIKLPFGDLFTQPHNKANTIFIAGGTGITPFLSLFNHSSFTEYSDPVLYAGFRNRDMNLYQTELDLAQKYNSEFRFSLVYQDEEGIMDINKIFAAGKSSGSFFISGPPAMIKAFKDQLIKNGISKDQVRTDDWE